MREQQFSSLCILFAFSFMFSRFSFIGEFREDKLHGVVLYTFANGDTLYGSYHTNAPAGDATFAENNGHSVRLPWVRTGSLAKEHAEATRLAAIEIINRREAARSRGVV